MQKKHLRLLIGFAAALLFGWLALRHVDFDKLLATLRGARIEWLLLALVIFLFGYACRIQRWRIMLQSANPQLRWRDAAGPLMASFAANNVLPFRAGDVLRAFAFRRELGVDAPAVLATLISERLLDFFCLLIFLALALFALNVQLAQISQFAGGAVALAAAACAVLIFAPRVVQPIFDKLLQILERLLPKLTAVAGKKIHELFQTFIALGQGGTAFKLFFWSLLAWACEGAVFWLTARALLAVEQPQAAWLALPVGTLSTLIPSTPGYVGTFDYFVQKSMALLGNGATASVAFAFLVHFVVWLPPTLLGGLYFLLRKKPAEPAAVSAASAASRL